MANLKDVQDIMKYIEEITSKLQYSSFEVALLIAERSELTHQEITSELVEKVQELSDSYDSLFNEALNEDLDEIFRKSKKQAIKITSVEELQKYIEGKGWVISDCSFNEDIDWEISNKCLRNFQKDWSLNQNLTRKTLNLIFVMDIK